MHCKIAAGRMMPYGTHNALIKNINMMNQNHFQNVVLKPSTTTTTNCLNTAILFFSHMCVSVTFNKTFIIDT